MAEDPMSINCKVKAVEEWLTCLLLREVDPEIASAQHFPNFLPRR